MLCRLQMRFGMPIGARDNVIGPTSVGDFRQRLRTGPV